jgi:GNAT superfamily N-acetyltransferase
VALNGEQVVAVGGLNIDPYYDSPSVGRIRHLYVHPDFRRRGVGARLMAIIEEHGGTFFGSLQLFTASTIAARFYEALDYLPVRGRWKVSHEKRIAA